MARNQSEADLYQMLQSLQDQVTTLQATVRESCYKTGDIKMMATSQNIDGWLPCTAEAYDKASFPGLDAELAKDGYPYGSTATKFYTPDLKGRSPMGPGLSDAPGATERNLGVKTGKETHQLTAAESGLRNHAHYANQGTYSGAGNSFAVGSNPAAFPSNAVTNDSGAADALNAHVNLGPRIVLNFYIKT